MNSRQRRGIILLLLSVLCAVGAAAGVYAVVDDAESKVGPEVTAYRLRSDVAAYRALDEGQFEKVSMPRRWLPATAVTDLAEVRGKIAVTPLRRGSLLQSDMIVNRPALAPGQQEIAIMIDAATGVAGKITPGSKVNIYATFDGRGGATGVTAGGAAGAGKDGKDAKDAKDANPQPVSKVIVSGAQVIEVGRLTPLDGRSGGARTGASGARQAGDAVPITFALDTKDAQRVAYAESFATHVRLALVAPGDDTGVSGSDRTYTLDGDK
ncbi:MULTISPECIES: Flp pilus assembly protein CpaB [Streptomyces]|uniref:Flp pilus assembly protein CpaB n=1 Tax=Streptomyces TaxID=1883 RepID=UPI00163CB247|nr:MULTISPECIES: Flp pilus assembly protein CpaB [Streptomyces]MBC2875248.1 Flp pilus assembly protein CpaB [Streptomyces sp. TYQ1024]UBI37073.1 Flp pilus assembly protein CpaB [Streptomyces mobaraensis]UKW29669.1 Flp pilus assembly protein CpaB [Streptomyces sp. TYQ1024]